MQDLTPESCMLEFSQVNNETVDPVISEEMTQELGAEGCVNARPDMTPESAISVLRENLRLII